MANEMFKILKPGEEPEHRIADTKFVNSTADTLSGSEFPTQEPKEIDNLIDKDDFFGLMKNASNYIPVLQALNLLQTINRPADEMLAAREAFMNPEEDPMTPPQATALNQWTGTAGPEVPFSEYMQHRNEYMPWLNERYRAKRNDLLYRPDETPEAIEATNKRIGQQIGTAGRKGDITSILANWMGKIFSEGGIKA